MKSYILICALLINAPLWSADTGKSTEQTGVAGGVIINESIQKLLDVDGVKPIFDTCAKNNTGTNQTSEQRTADVFKCLWNDNINLPKYAALKKKVLQAYEDEAKKAKTNPQAANFPQAQQPQGRSPANAPTPSASSDAISLSKQHNMDADYSSDPAVKALSDFYAKKLDEILDPDKALKKDEAKGAILSVDHKKFIELYKSELGKTIVNAFTSYCMDTDPKLLKCTGSKGNWNCKDIKATISGNQTQRENDRKQNLKDLKTANFEDDSQESAKWKACISAVAPNCRPSTDPNYDKTSSERACLIVDYVQAARKNIMVADAQLIDYKELDSATSINIAQNVKNVTDPKKLSSDALLEMTSKDVEDTLKDTMAKNKLEFEKCYKSSAIENQDACQKYLKTNTDESSQALVELSLRQELKEEQLSKELDKSDDKVKEYLKAEGYTPDEIKTITADKKSTDDIKQDIINRYKAQKEAIIAEMAARIDKKTSTTNGKIDPTNTKDTSKLANIESEMNSRSEDLKSLVQFNNIVASYLSISDGKKTIQRNTASLFAEVNSMKEADSKDLKANMGKAQLTEQKDKTGTNVDLSVDTINDELIKYNTQKQKKKQP